MNKFFNNLLQIVTIYGLIGCTCLIVVYFLSLGMFPSDVGAIISIGCVYIMGLSLIIALLFFFVSLFCENQIRVIKNRLFYLAFPVFFLGVILFLKFELRSIF